MSQIELKACQLRNEAVKRVNSTSYFKQWFSKSTTHLEESIEYFKRAGNLFKMAKNWSQAATAFNDAANLSFKADDPIEAAFNLIESASCYRNYNTSKAVEVYLKAIRIYQENGKFITAAKYYQIIAELLEDEFDNEEALIYFEKAAEIYRQECSFSAANKCYEKIAEYASLEQDYVKAMKIFEEIACFDLASSILRHAAKHYFFRAAICLLCTGSDVTPKLRTYLNIYPSFEDTREYQLILCLQECLNDGDVEGFENSVRKFDSVTELSQWHVTLLLRAQKQIEYGNCLPHYRVFFNNGWFY